MKVFVSSWMPHWRPVFGLLVLLAMTGCALPFVDGATKEIPAAEFKKPAKRHPVQ